MPLASAAQPAAAIDADAERAHAHGGLHRPLHGAAERHPALELLRDAFGDQRRVDLGLAHLDDFGAEAPSAFTSKHCWGLLGAKEYTVDCKLDGPGPFDAEGCRDGLAGDVVGGAAEAARDDHDVGCGGLLPDERSNPLDLVR